jgi:uncharacterized protein (DUF849 family)
MSADTSPLIIAVAPNGAYKGAADHAALPISVQQIAHTAAACTNEGAGMLHLHVRDAQGGHSLDADTYRRAIDTVRNAVGERLLIQVTTEAAGKYQAPAQMALVRELQPDCVSLAIRELVPDAASEPAAAEFFAWVCDAGTIPQFILYSGEELRRYQALRERGVIPALALPLLFVLGRYSSGQTSDPRALLPFLNELSHDAPWMVCAFGAAEHRCAATAAALGGHVRVGFENNLLLKDGSPAGSNADLVMQVREVAAAIGRPLADGSMARAMLQPRI